MGMVCGEQFPQGSGDFRQKKATIKGLFQVGGRVVSPAKAGPCRGMSPSSCPPAQSFRSDSVPLVSADMVVSGIVRELQLVIPNNFMELEELLYSSNICNPLEPCSLTTHFHITNVVYGS